MSCWLDSRIRGELKESELSGTNDEALSKLRGVLTQHEQRGEYVRQKADASQRGRAYWEAYDGKGTSIAVYWLSEGNEGRSR